MGGRGGSSGMGGGNSAKRYSGDGAIELTAQPIEVMRDTRDKGIVLEATTDNKGNITLKYAEPYEYEKKNSRSSYAKYKLSAGITDMNSSGRNDEIRSVGINWDKVNTVSGKTWGTQYLMKENGFKWDSAKKMWEK